MDQTQNTSLFSLSLDAQNSYTLRSAATWAKVLGVVSMIMGILFVGLGILIQQTVSRSYGAFENQYRDSGFSASTLGNMGMAVYLVFGLLYIVSAIFALNAGNKIGRGLKTNDMATLNSGFAGARNFFAFWAILMIIMLLFVVLGALGMMSSNN